LFFTSQVHYKHFFTNVNGKSKITFKNRDSSETPVLMESILKYKENAYIIK